MVSGKDRELFHLLGGYRPIKRSGINMRDIDENKILIVVDHNSKTEACIVIKHIEIVGLSDKEVIFFMISGKKTPVKFGSMEEAKSCYENIIKQITGRDTDEIN